MTIPLTAKLTTDQEAMARRRRVRSLFCPSRKIMY